MKKCAFAIGSIRIECNAFKCGVWMQRKPEWFKFTTAQPWTYERMEHGWHSRKWWLTIWRIQFGLEYDRCFPIRIDGVPT